MGDVIILAVMRDGRWRPGIGDPTFLGWVTVAAYFAAALACGRAWRLDRRARLAGDRSSSPTFWLILSLLLAFLGINKQLDLQSLLTHLALDRAAPGLVRATPGGAGRVHRRRRRHRLDCGRRVRLGRPNEPEAQPDGAGGNRVATGLRGCSGVVVPSRRRVHQLDAGRRPLERDHGTRRDRPDRASAFNAMRSGAGRPERRR